MFNKSKTNNVNPPTDEPITNPVEDEEMASEAPENTAPTPTPAPAARGSMMDMITTTANKPSILSEGFSFRGEIAAKGAIHVEGALNGQIQVDELTIGARGQVEGVVTCSSLHIKGKFSGTACPIGILGAVGVRVPLFRCFLFFCFLDLEAEHFLRILLK